MRILHKISAAVLAVILVACGSGSDEPETDSAVEFSSITGSSWTADSSDCENVRYPLPVTVSTSVEIEVQYLESVVACTNDLQYGYGSLWLHNVGAEAWVLNAYGAAIEYEARSVEAALLASGYPGVTVILPGDKLLISQSASQITWDLDAYITMAWEAEGEALAQAEALGEALLSRQLSKESAKGAAVLACALAAGEAAEFAANQPSEFHDQLVDALGIGASGSRCATSWKSAWSERFAPATDFLESAATKFRNVIRVAKIWNMIR